MKGYRVVTLGLPQLLNQIVVAIVEQQSDMEIVSEISELDAMVNLDDNEIPVCDAMIAHCRMNEVNLEIVRKLLFANPEMIIVNLSDDVRSGKLFNLELTALAISELSPDSLVKLIRDKD